MLRAMLDTDVCLTAIRTRDPALAARFQAEAAGLCLSTVALHELQFGAEKADDPCGMRSVVADFVSRLEVLPFDVAAAMHAGEIRAEMVRSGTFSGSYDVLIGGHARAAGLVLVTGRPEVFGGMEGVRCETWT